MINIKAHITEDIIKKHIKYIIYESKISDNLIDLRDNLEERLSKQYIEELKEKLNVEDKVCLISELKKFIDALCKEVEELKEFYEEYNEGNKDILDISNIKKNIFIGEPSQLNERINEFKKKYIIAIEVIDKESKTNKNSDTYSSYIINSLEYNKFSRKSNDIIGYKAFLRKLKSRGSDFYKNIKKETSKKEDDKSYSKDRINQIKKRVCNEIDKYSVNERMKNLNDSLIEKLKKVDINGITNTINEFCSIVNKMFDRCMRVYETTDFSINLREMINSEFSFKWNAYTFTILLGVKSCPYCNRQYITPIYSDKEGSVRADIDHFFAKSLHPYLSISLYNLIPCCKFCNSSLKGDKHFNYETHLNPYEYGFDNYLNFRFKCNKYTLTGCKNDEFTIVLEPNSDNRLKNIVDKAKNNAKSFKLESLYNYHHDEVKTLIRKKLVYNRAYCEELQSRLKDITEKEISEEELLEFIVGNTLDGEKYHERTLSKFYNDIVEQLEFFNNKKVETNLSDLDIEQLKKLIS